MGNIVDASSLASFGPVASMAAGSIFVFYAFINLRSCRC